LTPRYFGCESRPYLAEPEDFVCAIISAESYSLIYLVMLSTYFQKVNTWIQESKSDIYIAVLIFLVALASFGLGRLSVLWPEKEPITITNNELLITNDIAVGNSSTEADVESASVGLSAGGKYVASKNGKAYHFPWCPSALKIKEENKVWFETKTEAEGAGYRPAANCEGL